MDGIMQIGINGNTQAERQTIPNNFPAGFFSDDINKNYSYYYGDNKPLQVPFDVIRNMSLRRKEKISFESEIGHGEEEQDGDEFFDSKSKDYRADFCPHCRSI